MPEIKKKQLQGRRTMLGAATLSLAFSAGLWFTITGCSPQTGGRAIDIFVTSNKPGLRAYAIPNTTYLRNGGRAMLDDEEKMAQFQLNGRTAGSDKKGAKGSVMAGLHVIAVNYQGEWEVYEESVGFRNREFNIEVWDD